MLRRRALGIQVNQQASGPRGLARQKAVFGNVSESRVDRGKSGTRKTGQALLRSGKALFIRVVVVRRVELF